MPICLAEPANARLIVSSSVLISEGFSHVHSHPLVNDTAEVEAALVAAEGLIVSRAISRWPAQLH